MFTALNSPEICGEPVLMAKNHPAAASMRAGGSDRSDAASGLGPTWALEASWWLLLMVLQVVLGKEGCVCTAGVYRSICKRTH